MTSASSLVRSLLIYSICLPLAIYLGYLMAAPTDYNTFIGVGLVFFFLALPLLLRWHQILLVASWNMACVIFFLPGRPLLWLSMAWFGFLIAIIQYILTRRPMFLSSPMITRPLILLIVVVLATANLTGGIGLHSFGNETQGGKRYVLLLSAIIGYFALTSQAIPKRHANLYVGLFILGALTSALGELVPLVPSALYFIFLIFPVTQNGYDMAMDPSAGMGIMARLGGLAIASSAVFYVLLARYGVQGLFNARRPGRFLLLVTMVILTPLGGFRSALILMLLTFGVIFYLEGLFRSRLLPVFVLATVLGGTLLVGFAERLPLSMQRSLSFLPLDINPIARMSAEASTEWRLNIWEHVLPEVPRYLVLGKGYAINAQEADSVLFNANNQYSGQNFEFFGDYHNGPLSIIMFFGIPGVIAVVWLLVAGLRALWLNYQFGDPDLRRLNAFLLAYYLAQVVLFFIVFGSLYSDLVRFTGLLGLSVSLNGGIAKRLVAPQAKIRYQAFDRRPPIRVRPPISAVS